MSSDICNGATTTFDYNSGSNASLALAACARSVAIYADDSTVDIGVVTLSDGPSTFSVQVSLGLAFNNSDDPVSPTGRDFKGLNATALGTVELSGAIGRDLTGNISGVDYLYRFEVQGRVLGAIHAAHPGLNGTCTLVCGSITTLGAQAGSLYVDSGTIAFIETDNGELGGGGITAANGNIGTITVTGDITGRIFCEQGGITSISATRAITTADLPGSIVPIRAKNGILSIAALSISANIGTAANSGTGVVNLFKTTSGGMSGTLYCRQLKPPTGGESGIRINGDFTGTINLATPLSGDVRTEPIVIGGSLASGAQIIYNGASSLKNQVIINADNSSTPRSMARYSERQRNRALPKAQLPQTSSSLGNGSVGLVPFQLHSEECVPPRNNASRPSFLQYQFNRTTTESQAITLRWYGPVRVGASASIPPIRVLHVVGTSTFNVTGKCNIVVKKGSATGTSRDITVSGKPGFFFMPTNDPASGAPNSYYRIEPITTSDDSNRLFCDGITGSPPVSSGAESKYEFELLADCDNNGEADTSEYTCMKSGGCDTDVNYDGFVNGDDFDLFVSLFEAGNIQADFNGDGFVTGDDYDSFVAGFEAGC